MTTTYIIFFCFATYCYLADLCIHFSLPCRAVLCDHFLCLMLHVLSLSLWPRTIAMAMNHRYGSVCLPHLSVVLHHCCWTECGGEHLGMIVTEMYVLTLFLFNTGCALAPPPTMQYLLCCDWIRNAVYCEEGRLRPETMIHMLVVGVCLLCAHLCVLVCSSSQVKVFTALPPSLSSWLSLQNSPEIK